MQGSVQSDLFNGRLHAHPLPTSSIVGGGHGDGGIGEGGGGLGGGGGMIGDGGHGGWSPNMGQSHQYGGCEGGGAAAGDGNGSTSSTSLSLALVITFWGTGLYA